MHVLLGKIEDHFRSQPKIIVLLQGIALVILVGCIDYLTGYYLSFSIFYLIPITLVTWFGAKNYAVITSFFSAVIWLAADLLTVPDYPYPFIPFWNAALRLGFFLIVTFLLYTLKQVLERERKLARQDHLTKVYNSRAFYELAEAELERSRRYQHSLTIVYLDLDNFKLVNDRFGHHTGDQLLAIVGELICQNIRVTDIAARLGGDEFALLLSETGPEPAKQLVERIQERLLKTMNESGWPVTFSIGMVTAFRFKKGLHELIKTADNIMYEVKMNGKNEIKHRVVD